MILIQTHAHGAILPVRAKPRARVDDLIGEHAGALRVSVKAAPENGQANEAIIRLLADSLNLQEARFTLVSGATSRQKRFLIRGITAEDLLGRIEAALEPTLFEAPEADV